MFWFHSQVRRTWKKEDWIEWWKIQKKTGCLFLFWNIVSETSLSWYTHQFSIKCRQQFSGAKKCCMHASLQWRHNEPNDVSNHQPHDCLLKRLFRRRSKKTSKLRVMGLCAGNSPVTGEFPTQMASNAENVSIWWRHHVMWIVNDASAYSGYFG